MIHVPTLSLENALSAQGYDAIAGIDEAGRGTLAGPVVAAALVLPPNKDAPWLKDVRDSKQLTSNQRDTLFPHLSQESIWAAGSASVEEIDELGIVGATRLAMKRAVEQLSPPPQFLLVDGLTMTAPGIPQRAIIDGDRLSLSIAAASVIAKVVRDRQMAQLDTQYPGYGFIRHKGYGTPEHLAALRRLGPCPIHRRSFAPVRELLEPAQGKKSVSSSRRRLGAQGERIAANYLRECGYVIRETNFRCPEGEIDIVAQDGECLVFVEVRTRRGTSLGTPEESITKAKQKRLINLAHAYTQEREGLPQDFRIDVVAVEMAARGNLIRVELIKDALG